MASDHSDSDNDNDKENSDHVKPAKKNAGILNGGQSNSSFKLLFTIIIMASVLQALALHQRLEATSVITSMPNKQLLSCLEQKLIVQWSFFYFCRNTNFTDCSKCTSVSLHRRRITFSLISSGLSLLANILVKLSETDLQVKENVPEN